MAPRRGLLHSCTNSVRFSTFEERVQHHCMIVTQYGLWMSWCKKLNRTEPPNWVTTSTRIFVIIAVGSKVNALGAVP